MIERLKYKIKNIRISSSEVIRLEILRQRLILHMPKHLVGVDLDTKWLTLTWIAILKFFLTFFKVNFEKSQQTKTKV